MGVLYGKLCIHNSIGSKRFNKIVSLGICGIIIKVKHEWVRSRIAQYPDVNYYQGALHVHMADLFN